MRFELKEITADEATDVIKTLKKGIYQVDDAVLIVDCYSVVWTTLKSFKTHRKLERQHTDLDDAIDMLATTVEWHKEDGPAYISESGDKEWWVNDEEISKVDFCTKSKNGRKFKPNLDKIAAHDAWELFTPVEIAAAKMDKYIELTYADTIYVL